MSGGDGTVAKVLAFPGCDGRPQGRVGWDAGSTNSGGGADFSSCGRYRYRLWRRWDRLKPICTFIMLNPSTADAVENDATIERCERRARALGCGKLEVANLFALRSTDPEALYSAADPVGEHNDMAIRWAALGAQYVVCGWGNHGQHLGRAEAVLRALRTQAAVGACARPTALRVNKDGSPGHPLYLPYALQPDHYL